MGSPSGTEPQGSRLCEARGSEPKPGGVTQSPGCGSRCRRPSTGPRGCSQIQSARFAKSAPLAVLFRSVDRLAALRAFDQRDDRCCQARQLSVDEIEHAKDNKDTKDLNDFNDLNHREGLASVVGVLEFLGVLLILGVLVWDRALAPEPSQK